VLREEVRKLTNALDSIKEQGGVGVQSMGDGTSTSYDASSHATSTPATSFKRPLRMREKTRAIRSVARRDALLVDEQSIYDKDLNVIRNTVDASPSKILRVFVQQSILFNSMAMSQTGDAIRCASGEEITKLGDPGRGVFVVESGTFSIQMGLSRTTLQPGSSVGEISMLFGCARAESLTCDEDGCLWHLSRQDWLDLLLHHKIDVASTSWISMLLAEQSWSKDLTGAQREDLARASTLVAFSAGEAIFESGCGAESIGIVLQSQAFRTSRETQRWFPGECFGLDALTPGGRHRYSVTAEANLLILMLPRHILHDLPVATLDTLRHTLNCEFLHEISWFGGLTEMERRAAMQLAESKTYLPGSCMCGTSQRADELCVITFGTALRRSKPPQPHAENPRSFVCATALARCLFSHRNESGLSLDRKNRRRPSRMRTLHRTATCPTASKATSG